MCLVRVKVTIIFFYKFMGLADVG